MDAHRDDLIERVGHERRAGPTSRPSTCAGSPDSPLRSGPPGPRPCSKTSPEHARHFPRAHPRGVPPSIQHPSLLEALATLVASREGTLAEHRLDPARQALVPPRSPRHARHFTRAHPRGVPPRFRSPSPPTRGPRPNTRVTPRERPPRGAPSIPLALTANSKTPANTLVTSHERALSEHPLVPLARALSSPAASNKSPDHPGHLTRCHPRGARLRRRSPAPRAWPPPRPARPSATPPPTPAVRRCRPPAAP